MKLALQLYTLREYTKTPREIQKTLARVRKMGYQAVQMSGMGPIDAQELAKILAGEGLVAAATHVAWKDNEASVPKIVEDLHHWNCAYTAISSMPEGFRSAEGYHQFARAAGEAAKEFRAAGISLSYHNHSFEFARIGEKIGLEILFDESDPALEAEIDTYWVQHGGADPAAWIERLSGRVPLVHLKDMTSINGQPAMAEVGEGNLNWPRILAALERAETRWYMVEQDVCQRDPFESAQISYDHLTAWNIT